MCLGSIEWGVIGCVSKATDKNACHRCTHQHVAPWLTIAVLCAHTYSCVCANLHAISVYTSVPLCLLRASCTPVCAPAYQCGPQTEGEPLYRPRALRQAGSCFSRQQLREDLPPSTTIWLLVGNGGYVSEEPKSSAMRALCGVGEGGGLSAAWAAL